MTIIVENPQPIEVYVAPDGKLTIEGIKLIQRIVDALADHEERIVALEP